jgi:hypothetical protein
VAEVKKKGRLCELIVYNLKKKGGDQNHKIKLIYLSKASEHQSKIMIRG